MVSAVADGRVRTGPSATAVHLLQLVTLSGVALLTWLRLVPSTHPALLPTMATIVGGRIVPVLGRTD